MKGRFAGVVWEALKVAVAAWGVVWLEPWATRILPTLDPIWRYLGLAVVLAVSLELIFQLIIGWPRLEVAWTGKKDAQVLQGLRAQVTTRRPDSFPFDLRVSAPKTGWLSHLLLRGVMSSNILLQIRLDQAPVVPTVEYSSTDASDLPAVVPNDVHHGFDVSLGTAPRRPDTWRTATVRWRCDVSSIAHPYNIYYVLWHPNPVARILLFFVIKSSNARTFQIVGS